MASDLGGCRNRDCNIEWGVARCYVSKCITLAINRRICGLIRPQSPISLGKANIMWSLVFLLLFVYKITAGEKLSNHMYGWRQDIESVIII